VLNNHWRYADRPRIHAQSWQSNPLPCHSTTQKLSTLADSGSSWLVSKARSLQGRQEGRRNEPASHNSNWIDPTDKCFHVLLCPWRLCHAVNA
jgi:hypothetical protein